MLHEVPPPERAPLCERVAPLAGCTIGVTADRRAAEQADLLRGQGAEVIVGPVLTIVQHIDDVELRLVTEQLIEHPPDVLVATTGIGVRGWIGAAETWGLDAHLMEALRQSVVIARGPKPKGVLQQLGVPVWRTEPTERLDRLVDDLVERGVAGQRIAIQYYGNEVPWALSTLELAGASVVPIRVYRWSQPADPVPAQRLLAEVLAKRVDAVTFTSPAAVRHLFELAGDQESGELRAALAGPVLAACVGPVTAEALEALGATPACNPERGRLGLLVRSLARAVAVGHRHLRTHDGELVIRRGLVVTESGQVVLSGRERAVFDALTERPGAAVGRATLVRRVWGRDHDETVVDTALSRLRRSLAPIGLQVSVVQRRGWSIRALEVGCPVPDEVDGGARAHPTLRSTATGA
jgi:uroporphyrinogen-III synthase